MTGVPRRRFRRAWEELVGPEATRQNTVTTVALTAGGVLGAALAARRRTVPPVLSAVLAALAADLVGGVYVNNTRACARWYERPGQGLRQHLRFAALHVHPAVVASIDRRTGTRSDGPAWALTHYCYLLLATFTIRAFPRWRRQLGVTLTAGGVALDRALGPSTVAPWFAWTYHPKLLLGHAAAALWSDQELAGEAHREMTAGVTDAEYAAAIAVLRQIVVNLGGSPTA